MSLKTYRKKRDFRSTPEPSGDQGPADSAVPHFVVQKHDASRLHYDFRLEMDGVLKSWAVPKGPSFDPGERSLAVHVEDHPLEYADFEGVIPKGHYGGGTVMVWDRGVWVPLGDPVKSYKKGKLKFRLEGERLQGGWTLVRMGGRAGDDGKNWLLIKSQDKQARADDEHDVVEGYDKSVVSGRTMDEIAASHDRLWTDGGEVGATEASPTVAELPGATKRALPKTFKPQLATLVSEVPTGDDWLHELKFDGYRILSRCASGRVQLLTRRGKDWSDRFPTITQALSEMQLSGTILDGEVVVLDRNGTSDFQALQNVLRSGRDDEVVYYVFDAPFLGGYDLTKTPQLERKEAVRRLLAGQPTNGLLRYSDHIRGRGGDVVDHACQHALEGVICKRADAPYEQRRSRNWVKVKCLHRQEFVIVGWTNPSGSRPAFGALLLGYYENGKLIFSGRVGTGFNEESLLEIGEKLSRLETEQPPLDDPPTGAAARGVHWVNPKLVAEVEFTEWTDDGALRHPSFKGLREDKRPEEIRRELPKAAPKLMPEKDSSKTLDNGTVAGVHITSPDRVVYPQQRVTKRELAQYYAEIADRMLPYVADRPLTVVRCPQGRAKKCFYQKHVTESLPPAVGYVEVEEESGAGEYITINDRAGLVSLVQMGVLEFHPWGSRNDRLDKPDLLVMDLDPGPGAEWRLVVDGVRELRERLAQAGIESFLRTTGGKGLHVVAPLTRRQGWAELKAFAKSLAQSMASDSPQEYIATASKAKREGKVYVDYLRNAEGATAIANYSTRAREGAPIATPLGWDELSPKLTSDKYTLRNIRQRLSSLTDDPWEAFFEVRQSITRKAMNTVAPT